MNILKRIKNVWVLSGYDTKFEPEIKKTIWDKIKPREKGFIIQPKSEEREWMEDMFERNDRKGEDTEIGKIEEI